MRMAKPRPRRPSISLGPEPKDIAIPPTANTSSMDCARRVSPVDGTQPFSRDRTRSNNLGVEGSRKHFSYQRLMPLVRSEGVLMCCDFNGLRKWAKSLGAFPAHSAFSSASAEPLNSLAHDTVSGRRFRHAPKSSDLALCCTWETVPL